ncbi:retrotransposon protein, putative, ty1-copia subclass [Tanacetum coccineum]|uniref:Retrotransposon protein, putative, ty1-copia subclass n=1 Tax=Tanacetum coccineum TaxID=301880 RepID=A0ABQ5B0P9_9ASTR
MTTNQTTSNSIRLILEKEKLNGSHFLDWYHNLGIVLKYEQKLHHLEEALPEAHPATTNAVVYNAYTRIPYLDQMEHLGYPMPLVLGVNLIINSLSNDCDQFVKNYNMHIMENTIHELHGKGKGKSKLAYAHNKKIPPPVKKEHPAKDAVCHQCHQHRHWRRNCPLYLAELKKSKASTFASQGLRGIWNLNKGALELYAGNGNRKVVKAIWIFGLILPSGMVLDLENFHFLPSITRGVISLSCLWDNGFLYKFTNYGAISVSKDNLFYFNHILRDGIFEIDMHNHVSNERSIYTCSNKKSKRNLDSTFLWHCLLGHINKKRITKLQHDGLLKLIDDKSFDVCVSCISGKMTRKPFTHAFERANELLGLIHSDTVGCKWLFKKNTDIDGNIHTYKSRLVAKGFTQTYGVDYEETFSSVAVIKAIRILIAIAAFYDYDIWQIDVKTAFLNGHLNEDLGKSFAMKDLGEAAYILGIKIYRDRSRRLIGLSQNVYIDKILKRFKMDASKCGSLLMQPNVELSKTQGPSTPVELTHI